MNVAVSVYKAPAEWPVYKGVNKDVDQRIYDQYGLDRVNVLKRSRPSRSAIKRAFLHLQEWYKTHIPASVREKLALAKDLTRKAVEFISHVKEVVSPIFDMLNFVVEAVVKKSSAFLKVLRKVAYVSFLSIGSIGYYSAKHIDGIIKAIKIKDMDLLFDKSLSLVEDIADLTNVGEMFLSGLREFGGLPLTKTVELAGDTLAGLGIIFSTATLALSVKRWTNIELFRRKIAKLDINGVKDLVNSQKNRNLKHYLGVKDAKEFKIRLDVISKKGKEESQKCVKAIKKQLVVKEICQGLKALACVISIIASTILLFTPLAPVGFALLAVATAIGIAETATDYIMTKKFESTIEKLSGSEGKDAKPLRDYLWKKEGKKAFRRKVHKLPSIPPRCTAS